MDIKEQAYKYLIDKGCLSVGQTYTAFQVERMLTEFAQEQVKLFYQPAVISSLPSECQNGWENSDYCMERGKCKKCL